MSILDKLHAIFTLDGLFGSGRQPPRDLAREQYEAMRDAMARETPEEKARFYLGVAAHLGNQSAAERLRKMDER